MKCGRFFKTQTLAQTRAVAPASYTRAELMALPDAEARAIANQQEENL